MLNLSGLNWLKKSHPCCKFSWISNEERSYFHSNFKGKYSCSNSNENEQKINEVHLTYFESEALDGGDSVKFRGKDYESNCWSAWWIGKTCTYIKL